MIRPVLVVLAALLLGGAVRPAPAAAITPEAALERFLTAGELQADWFAPSFLAAVPFDQLAPIRAQMTAGLGEFRSIRKEGDRWAAVYEKGILPAYVTLDAEGRFTGLRLLYAVLTEGGLDGAVAMARELEGTVSLLVLRDGVEAAALDPDAPLAVGSTFKLAVLAALRERIEAGEDAWDEVIRLDAARRSLPSGVTQGWPDGSAVTLETLATLMISISDNTATDALVRHVGRERVEAAGGERNRPFLTTREAFQLKSPEGAAFRTRFLAGSVATRRAILDSLAGIPLPGGDLFAAGPVAPEIEWFLSARELCALMGRVGDLPLMGVNPGLAAPSGWKRVAYKGGSEPGVLNFTTELEAESGETWCVCMTWNDPAAEEAAMARVYGALLEAVRAAP